MKTIYFYEHNWTNLWILIIVTIVLVALIVAMLFFLPLIRQSLCLVKAFISKALTTKFPEVTRAGARAIIVFTVFLYLFLFLAMFFCGKSLIDCKFNWINTDVSKCTITTGKCENFSYEIFESRDYILYTCDFTVNNIEFSNVEISQPYNNAIKYLSKDYEFDVYYYNLKGKNVVVRIDTKSLY